MSIASGNKADFQKDLLEKGFYPEDLPPVFRVTNFWSAADSADLFSADQIERNKPLALSRYNETKRGGQRRVFSVANPLFFVDVGAYLAKHRRSLSAVLNKSRLSRSIPRYDHSFARFMKIDSHAEFTTFRRKALSKSRYIVKTVISRFFHSIYTHSIPWAVHGKAAAKLDRRVKSSALYANKLDYLLRQAQDQQTIGIPVGPDTSRIVSELIGAAIDQEFVKQVGAGHPAVRHVDDIYIGASNLEEAEALLSSYRDSIRKYELDINDSKTAIFTARSDLEPFWPIAVRREIESYSAFSPRSKRSEFGAYLDEIIRLANNERDDGIIKYAIRRMDDRKLWISFWDLLEPFLIRVAVNFPHCLDYVARVVAWRHRRFHDVSPGWSEVCLSLVGYHAPLGNDSEVVWTSWLLKEIGGKMPSSLCERVIERCGPLSVLLMLDLEASGNVKGRFPRKAVLDRVGDNPAIGNDWLLSYEAERSFSYRLKAKNRADYSQIGDLIDRGAAFYDVAAAPFVFQDVADIDSVDEALEDRIGLYEDEDEDENDIDDGEYDADAVFRDLFGPDAS